MSKKKKEARFKIEMDKIHDHPCNAEYQWDIIYPGKGSRKEAWVYSFKGHMMYDDTIRSVEFSPDGNEVIAKNGKGEIVERVSLPSESELAFIDT